MPVVAAIAGVVGAVAGIASGISGGVARKKQADMAESVGNDNARILEERAVQTEKIMGFKLGDFDKNAGRFLGSTDSTIAASGIEGTGSSKMSRDESINNLVSDRENLFDNYAMQAKELREKARQQREYGGTQADIAGWQGVSDVAGGVSTMASGIGMTAGWGQTAGWWG